MNLLAKAIRVRELDMASRDNYTDRLCGIMPLVNGALLKRLTDEGFLRSVIVTVDEVKAYCVWLSFTLDGGCHLNYAVALQDGDNSMLPELSRAIEALASQQGCSYVEFSTARAGLIAKAEQLGYKADGVLLRKAL